MTTKFGHIFFSLALIFFGLQHFLYVFAVHGPVAGPPWILTRPLWAAVIGAFLLLVGVLLATKRMTQFTASLLAAVLFLYVVFLYVPGLVRHLHDPRRWTSAAELTCLCGAALVLAGLGSFGRVFYGVPLIVFGIQHFLYAHFISTLMPAWIPYRLFWAYFVGTAFIAAAVSIATKGQARLATILLGTMFLSWVIILHAPRVAAHLRNGNEWTSAFIALAMCGGAWIVEGASSK